MREQIARREVTPGRLTQGLTQLFYEPRVSAIDASPGAGWIEVGGIAKQTHVAIGMGYALRFRDSNEPA